MTIKEIDTILKKENGIILLKKESEQTVLESFLSNWISIISALYFLKRKKQDILILTEHRMVLFLRNHNIIERIFMGITALEYNGVKMIIKVTDQNQDFSFPVKHLNINYEESKLIKQRLNEFRIDNLNLED